MRLELNRRADYAIRTTMYLARESTDRLVNAPTIARQMDVPQGYLPHIMRDLVRAQLVEAVPGRGGGYRLARSPREVSVLDVIEAVEDDVRRRTCVLRRDACAAIKPCSVHQLFASAQDALLELLAGATIQDVASGSFGGAVDGVSGTRSPA